MKKWDSKQRFDSAEQWINASLARRGAQVDKHIIAILATCCVKRNGVWRLRKTDPKNTTQYMVLKAFRFAQHASKWGNLAPWGEGFTAKLMEASDFDRAVFNKAFDQFIAIRGKA